LNFNKSAEEKQTRPLGRLVTVYLSLGSNLGDSRQHIEDAVKHLKESDGITVMKLSGYYSSAPLGMESENMFLNRCVEIATSLEPLALLDRLEEIEFVCGRTAGKGKHHDRTLDMDIILYGEMVVSFPRLKVPHPRMAERRFVLEPLAEIAPDLIHPTLRRKPARLIEAVSDQQVARENFEKT